MPCSCSEWQSQRETKTRRKKNRNHHHWVLIFIGCELHWWDWILECVCALFSHLSELNQLIYGQAGKITTFVVKHLMFENFNVIVTRWWRSFEYYNEYFMEIVKKNKTNRLIYFPLPMQFCDYNITYHSINCCSYLPARDPQRELLKWKLAVNQI